VRQILHDEGFTDIFIDKKDNSEDIIRSWNAGQSSEELVFSGYIHARKPQ